MLIYESVMKEYLGVLFLIFRSFALSNLIDIALSNRTPPFNSFVKTTAMMNFKQGAVCLIELS